MRVLARGGAVFPVPGRWQTRVVAGGDGGAGPGAGLGRRWDVALSFAGAQRDYVEQVAADAPCVMFVHYAPRLNLASTQRRGDGLKSRPHRSLRTLTEHYPGPHCP